MGFGILLLTIGLLVLIGTAIVYLDELEVKENESDGL